MDRKGDEDLLTGLFPDINQMEMENRDPGKNAVNINNEDYNDKTMNGDDENSESEGEDEFDDAAEMEAIETICDHSE